MVSYPHLQISADYSKGLVGCVIEPWRMLNELTTKDNFTLSFCHSQASWCVAFVVYTPGLN